MLSSIAKYIEDILSPDGSMVCMSVAISKEALFRVFISEVIPSFGKWWALFSIQKQFLSQLHLFFQIATIQGKDNLNKNNYYFY